MRHLNRTPHTFQVGAQRVLGTVIGGAVGIGVAMTFQVWAPCGFCANACAGWLWAGCSGLVLAALGCVSDALMFQCVLYTQDST